MKSGALRAILNDIPDHVDVWVRRNGEVDGLYADHVIYKVIYEPPEEDINELNTPVRWVVEIVTE